MMQFSDYIFYFFSSILILASLKVITANNPVYSALSLVLAFLVQRVFGYYCMRSFWQSPWF